MKQGHSHVPIMEFLQISHDAKYKVMGASENVIFIKFEQGFDVENACLLHSFVVAISIISIDAASLSNVDTIT